MLLGVNIDIAVVRNARWHDLSQPVGGGTGCRNARCGFDYHAPRQVKTAATSKTRMYLPSKTPSARA